MTNDVTQLQSAVFMSLRIMLRAPLMIVFGTAMALYVHFGLSLVLLIAVPMIAHFHAVYDEARCWHVRTRSKTIR